MSGTSKPVSRTTLRDGQRLWLWRNGDHYIACAQKYPTHDGGDPMTLGEPAAIAIFRVSSPPIRPKAGNDDE